MKMHQGFIKELVRERCKERGLSFSRLAMEIGVNPTYLLFVLHGRNISRPLVQKIAEYLGYSEFQAHRVGWRSFLAFSRSNALMGSKPTAWDGDFRSNEFKLLSPHGSKPTVWDGDFTTYIISFLLPGTPFQAHRVGW